LRFDPDETSRKFAMSLQSICVLDGKPVHQIRGSRREVLELAFLETQTVDVDMGLVRPKPDENPASNTAARVSLPLTMSNIPRTKGQNQSGFDRLSAASVVASSAAPFAMRRGV